MQISTPEFRTPHLRWLGLVLCIGGSHLFAQDSTDLDCMVKPEMYINLASPVDGVLAEVHVNKSDTVVRGQALARLESLVEEANVDIAREEAETDNLVKARRLLYKHSLRKQNRIGDLFRAKAASSQDYDDAVIETEIAQTELLQAEVDQQRAKLQLELAKAQLEQKIIRSPVDGIVVERYLMPGESVENRPILQLAKVDPLQVEVLAPAQIFGKVLPAMEVEIFPDYPTDSRYLAKVSIIDRIIDAASGTFTILLELPNPDEKLVGGTRCIARFAIPSDIQIGRIKQTGFDGDLPAEIRALLKE